MEKKSTLLKVMGIIMIIIGSLALVGSLIMMAFTGLIDLSAEAVGTEIAELFAMYTTTYFVITLISSLIMFIAGIVGVKNYKKPEKAQICLIFAALVLVSYVVGIVISIAGDGGSAVLIVMDIIFGLVIPVLYLLGALKLKKLAAG